MEGKMKKYLFFVIIMAVCSLTSCTQTPKIEPEKNCTNFYPMPLPKKCVLINDTWGQKAIDIFKIRDAKILLNYILSGVWITVEDYEQCIYNYSENDKINCKWTWRWSSPLGSSWVKAYPEILYGKNPCNDLASTDPDFPKKISELGVIEVSYKANMKLTGTKNNYNLCFDLWITDSKNPNFDNIMVEVMVWEIGTFRPGIFGLPIPHETVTIDGLSYELYSFIHSSLKFEYRAFIPNFTPNIENRIIRLYPFINYLKVKGTIKDDHYLSNITFGNELCEGSGETIINDYNITKTHSDISNLYDDFATNNLNDNWVLSGTPKPRWVSSAFGQSGLLDNNGDGWHNSEAYSKTIIGSSSGYTIESEVYVNVSNTSGCWVAPSIGITKSQNPAPVTTNNSDIPSGIRFTLTFEGGACWATPSQYRSHGWFSINIWAEDNTLNSPATWSLNGDIYLNGWHTLKIVVQSDRYVKFFCDNNLLWISTKRLHPDLMINKNVLLGDRSSNSAGKAYHNWVKVTEQ